MDSSQLLFMGAWLLLGIGIYGLIVARSLLKIIIVLQLMVRGAILMLVLAGNVRGQLALGQSIAVVAIAIDTLVAVIGLALVIQVKAHTGTLRIDEIINTEG